VPKARGGRGDALDGEGLGDGQAWRARRAVAAVFTAHGTLSGSFATRIPWIREHLGLSPGWLGIALVFATLGASAAMPLSARLSHRYGPRRALAGLSLGACLGLALPALAPGVGWLCGALFVFGCGLGLMDVTMNAHGVQVEERCGRSVMSGLHGMWSVGTLLGGAGGALAAQAGLDARLHLAAAAPVLAAAAVTACRWTLDVRPDTATDTDVRADSAHAGHAAQGSAQEPAQDRPLEEPLERPQEPPRFALPGRGALAIGLVGFCAVFAEGASMDWSGIYLHDVTHAAPGLAAAAYTAFACTMAAARLVGDVAVRRFGPVRTVRVSGLVSAAGGVLVCLARTPAPAVAGYALIGVGIAVVVPLCFAAAGRTAGPAPGQAIAGVATLAYASGLAAPAAVGWIAQVTSLSLSFGLVTVLLLGLVLGAGVLAPPPRTAEPERPAAPMEGAAAPEGHASR
jgi:MFS family permease